MNAKIKIARLSVLSNTILIIIKLIVGIFTGSVSIISEAIHSTMDLVAAIIAFFSVRISDKPADAHHPYGHGKIENISGVIEALLIFSASVWIIVEALKKIINPEHIESLGIGFIVMFVSAGINFIVSKKLYKVAKEEDSIALEADALHLKADVYTSLGVGFGLLLIWITKLNFLDPIVAILVAIFILKEAYYLLKTAFNPLLDVSLSEEEISIITNAISKHSSVYCDFHDLKTRKSGSTKYIDLHLVFPEDMSIKSAHDICDIIEDELESLLKNTDVMIHLESCTHQCTCCNHKC
ncbi:cation diffusion facilitator family transporter [Clostridium magnum]|uniref:Ferrous-iron efflux pump FieF n=1 Tax=Clostridium magnum DSM 2767 TaxID=1121326 RepID=A0A161Y5I3_9CLOT|nr:cation diffusion facilitator family transporter [Clostridium magnum]KZL93479.1 ferrous-iron efflux pump FieF [Clostridium magnum DSM 2767]SHI27459.1 cation diffusion facilitator family transporter [Clostridium magnum DSM 2767]